jgi:hypothetical protein
VLATRIRDDHDSYDAYFRGYAWPMHYFEFEGHRYWPTYGEGTDAILNRCMLDSVEPLRGVDEGAKPVEEWQGPP